MSSAIQLPFFAQSLGGSPALGKLPEASWSAGACIVNSCDTLAQSASSRQPSCVSSSMPVRLIINADDFGLTRGVNRAIAELHEARAVTSATLMANGAAFDDAVAVALDRPSLGVGCHIVLVDGTPVSDPASVPTLLGPNRRTFRTSLADFALGVLRGAITQDDIEREALAQIQKLQHAGLKLTHVDTHKHTHLLARVTRPVIRALEQSGIRCIRNPFEPRWAATLGGSTRRSLFVRAFQPGHRRFEASPPIAAHRILTTRGTIGISATGHLNSSTLSGLLQNIPDGTWELVCHPGYNDSDLDAITTRLRTHRETELQALLAAFAKSSSNPLHPSGLKLIHYGELGT
ncbi:MAG TPA: ChbG/HpnK family deacetylase [Bryocella sp.]|nr:ChbG/HpnK family deacetylase [Bryocella sp.]